MQKFAKYGDNKQKCTKPELPTDPAKRKESKKNKESRTKRASSSKCEQTKEKNMRGGKCDLGVMWECDEDKEGKRH